MSAPESARPAPRTRSPMLAFGPFTFDPDNHLLRRGSTELAAPPRVLGVLNLLLERAGDLVARQDLIDRVWKDAFVTDTSLAEAISLLRQMLGDEPQSPTYVQTVHRRGYRFIAPVEAVDPLPFAAARQQVTASSTAPDDFPSIRRELAPWTVAILCALLAASAIFQVTRRREAPLAPGRFAIQLDPGQWFDGRGTAVALAPDGAQIAWAACGAEGCRLYVRPLDGLDARALSGTEDAESPFYSPDGAWLGFFAGGRLKKVATSGGAPIALADVSHPLGAAWAPQGRIIFGSSLAGGLWEVSANGGAPEPLTTPRQEDGEVRHAWPAVAPDGRTVFFSIGTTPDEDAPSRLAVGTLQGRSRLTSWTTLLSGVGIARPMSSDLIVLARGAELQAVRFDAARRELAGLPRTIVPAVASTREAAQFAVSLSGSLLHVAPAATPAGSRALTWRMNAGPAQPVHHLDVAGVPAVSGDGRRLAWAGPGDGARADIHVGDLDRGAVTRLTHGGLSASPVWSPDGRRLFFARSDGGPFRVASISADGGDVSWIPSGVHHAFPASVSSDGRMLAFVAAGGETKRDVWVVGTAAGSTPREVVRSPFDETAPALSPDGSLLAFQSDDGGRWDVYVQRIADGRRTIVSTSGGERPFWTGDGAAILYRAGTSVMRADVGGDPLTVGSPFQLADLGRDVLLGVAGDGRLLVASDPTVPNTTAVLGIHWEHEARRLLGPTPAPMPR